MQDRFKLANPEHRLPMPDRGAGVFFSASPQGEGINPLNPFYARMIADGDLVPADPEPQPERQALPDPASPPTEGEQ